MSSANGLHDQIEAAIGRHRERDVDLGSGTGTGAGYAGVPHDADDLEAEVVRTVGHGDALSQRADRSQEAAREFLIDHDDAPVLCHVGVVEVAAGDERRLHGGQVVGRDRAGVDSVRRHAAVHTLPGDGDVGHPGHAGHRQIGGGRDGAHARQPADARLQIGDEWNGIAFVSLRIADTQDQLVVRVEAGTRWTQCDERRDQQAGDDEHDARDRDLHRHEQGTEPALPRGAGDLPRPFLQRVVEVEVAGGDERSHRERNRGQDRDGEREGEDGGARVGVVESRHAVGREVDDQLHRPCRQPESGHGRPQREQQAFRQQSPGEAEAGSAQGHADGDLTNP
jgi:hypothetical protein